MGAGACVHAVIIYRRAHGHVFFLQHICISVRQSQIETEKFLSQF